MSPLHDKHFPHHDISYILNSNGYRSENFDNTQSENNYLFSGCSVTFGIGIPYRTTWAYQLNKKLGGESFFNLAINGGNAETCISDIYTYIKKFGKPKGVFLIIPTLTRHHFFDYIDGKFNMKIRIYGRLDDKDRPALDGETFLNFDRLLFDFINRIRSLEQYLESINVPFLWTTWAPGLNDSIKRVPDLNNYFDMLTKDATEIYVEDEIKEFIGHDFWLRARDDSHPPISVQYVYYKMFMAEYEKRYSAKKSAAAVEDIHPL